MERRRLELVSFAVLDVSPLTLSLQQAPSVLATHSAAPYTATQHTLTCLSRIHGMGEPG